METRQGSLVDVRPLVSTQPHIILNPTDTHQISFGQHNFLLYKQHKEHPPLVKSITLGSPTLYGCNFNQSNNFKTVLD